MEETRGFRCGANDETDSIGASSARADRAESELKQEARSSYAKRRGRVSNAVVVQEEREGPSLTICRLEQSEKAVGQEPQIEPWLKKKEAKKQRDETQK